MRSIPNQDHSAAIPLVDLDPLDGPKMELLVRLQGSEIRRNRRAESNKTASEAFEASDEGIVEARPADRSKTISAALAHRGEPEKASLAHENHHVQYPSTACRHAASPSHPSHIPHSTT